MSYQERPKTGQSDAARVTAFRSFKALLCKPAPSFKGAMR